MALNKMNTRDKIIYCATQVFMEKGILGTVMGDIAKEVGLTRRTLYRYFKTKESIAYEVMLELLQQWNDYQRTLLPKFQGTGIERLETFLKALVDYMEDNKHIMKFMGEFDFYFRDTIAYEPDEDVLNRVDNVIHVSDQLIGKLIGIGVADQTIKLDWPVDVIIATISNILWVFGQRIAIRGQRIEEEAGFSAIDLVQCQIEMYIKVLEQ